MNIGKILVKLIKSALILAITAGVDITVIVLAALADQKIADPTMLGHPMPVITILAFIVMALVSIAVLFRVLVYLFKPEPRDTSRTEVYEDARDESAAEAGQEAQHDDQEENGDNI